VEMLLILLTNVGDPFCFHKVRASNMAIFQPTNDPLATFHSNNETSVHLANDFLQIITKFIPRHIPKHCPSAKGEWFRLVNNVVNDKSLHCGPLNVPRSGKFVSYKKHNGIIESMCTWTW